MKARSLILLFLISYASVAQEYISAVYAGGPIYNERDYSISELKQSGFNTIIVWTMHVDEAGSLNFNAEFPLVADGAYVGDKAHPDFRSDIKALTKKEGTGKNSCLYKNFKALLAAIPETDAINNDDDLMYDVASSAAFYGFTMILITVSWYQIMPVLLTNHSNSNSRISKAIALKPMTRC